MGNRRRPTARTRATSRLTVELARLGGRVDRIEFAPQNDFLRGTEVVEEPHSFDVTIVARHAGREHRFEYESYEGRTTIAADVARAAGIGTGDGGARHDQRRAACSTARSRPDATRVRDRACALPRRDPQRQPQRRRRRARPATRSRRSNRTKACRPTRSRRRSTAPSPRATPRPASRPTAMRCSRSRISRRCGPSSTCSRATAHASGPGSPSTSPATTAPPPRVRSTTLRRSATARRRA